MFLKVRSRLVSSRSLPSRVANSTLIIAISLPSISNQAVWSTVVVNGLKAFVAVQLLETQREGGGLFIIGFAAFQALSTYILSVSSPL